MSAALKVEREVRQRQRTREGEQVLCTAGRHEPRELVRVELGTCALRSGEEVRRRVGHSDGYGERGWDEHG